MKRTRINLAIVFTASLIIGQVQAQFLKQVGFYSTNGTHAIHTIGDKAYLGNGKIVNVADPANPVEETSINMSPVGTSVAGDAGYVYYGTGIDVRLKVVSIAGASPYQVGSLAFPQSTGGIYGIAVKANTLFLAMGNDGIVSVNVSDKSAPVKISQLQLSGGQARDIIIRDDIAFVAHHNGLHIIDISDPANMIVRSTIGQTYLSIDLANNYVVLGKPGGGADVYDVSDLNNITAKFQLATSSNVWDVKFGANNLVFLSSETGLFAYELMNSSPILKGEWANPNGQSFGVSIKDSVILHARLVDGVALYTFDKQLLGIKKIQSNTPVLYPNPCTGTIRFSLPGETEYRIYNLAGQQVVEGKSAMDAEIDLSALGKGAYFINVINNNRNWSQGLIIQ